MEWATWRVIGWPRTLRPPRVMMSFQKQRSRRVSCFLTPTYLCRVGRKVLAKLRCGDVLGTQKPRRPWTHFALVEFVADGKLRVIECEAYCLFFCDFWLFRGVPPEVHQRWASQSLSRMGTTMLHAEKQNALIIEAIKRDHFKLRWTSEGFTDEAGSKVSGVAQWCPATCAIHVSGCLLEKPLDFGEWRSRESLGLSSGSTCLAKNIGSCQGHGWDLRKHHEWSRALSRPRPDVFKLLCR